MTPAFTPKILIPAAGFGKRVGSPEAKEMLLNPRTGKPMIDGPIQLALSRGWTPLVITRPEKKELIDFVKKTNGCELQIIEASMEWPHTLLLSKENWGGINIVVLPDTEFEPINAIDEIAALLKLGTDVCFGVFDVEDPRTWGIVMREGMRAFVCEKPESKDAPKSAWGLFGFARDAGEELLSGMLLSAQDHHWFEIERPVKNVHLAEFRDLTRA